MDEPPCTLSTEVTALASRIWRLLGRFEGQTLEVRSPKLRRTHLVRTVQGTCAIEGNALSTEQVTRILEGKRVLGSRKEILEIKNTHRAYLTPFDPLDMGSLLKAHAMIMQDLIDDAGRFRRGPVVVGSQERVVHIGPPADRIEGHMKALFEWLHRMEPQHDEFPLDPLIRSAVFHYEFEFIHPFSDGNGRIGRLWQHLLLTKAHPAFDAAPVESIVRDRQRQYYAAIAASSARGDAEPFVRFSLATIQAALETEATERRANPVRPEDRLANFLWRFQGTTFSRQDYIKAYPSIKGHTASRDLAMGVAQGQLVKIGERRTARYRRAQKQTVSA